MTRRLGTQRLANDLEVTSKNNIYLIPIGMRLSMKPYIFKNGLNMLKANYVPRNQLKAIKVAVMMFRIVSTLDFPHTYLTPTVALRGHSMKYLIYQDKCLQAVFLPRWHKNLE